MIGIIVGIHSRVIKNVMYVQVQLLPNCRGDSCNINKSIAGAISAIAMVLQTPKFSSVF